MSFFIYAGYVSLMVFVHGGGCLEETGEKTSDSLLQFLLKRTQEQDSKIADLEAKMVKDRSKLEDRISSLEAKVRLSESAQGMLEKTVEDLHKIIQDLKIKTFVENRETEVPVTAESKKAIPSDVQGQKAAAVNFKMEVSKQKRAPSIEEHSGHAVAFYAFLNHVESSPSEHHTVIFDNVVTNTGSAYSQYTGVFTAPINGVFVFNWNLYSGYRGVLISNLMVNSDNKGGRRSDSTTSDEDHSSSGCLVVALHQGDKVFVITHSTHSIKGPIISYPGFYESSFSGWLLA